MLIDSHCHIDQLAEPEKIARQCEAASLQVVAVTNLPSHYAVGADCLRGFRFVHAALGLHPLAAEAAHRELAAFRRLAPYTDWIGEIGLDFSRHGAATREIQLRNFDEALRMVADRPRFISLHSRGAEGEVIDALEHHGIKSAVFHWYTGSFSHLDRLLGCGHFLSVNPAMLSSAIGKRVLEIAPRERVLCESDGPHARVGGRRLGPQDVYLVYEAFAARWRATADEVEAQLQKNFDRIGAGARS